jgi:RNase P subunit RPR2
MKFKHFPRKLRKFCNNCNMETAVYFPDGSKRGYCKSCGRLLFDLKPFFSKRIERRAKQEV